MFVKLSEICDIVPGFAFKSKDFSSFGFPVIKIANICPPYVDNKNCSYVDLSNYDRNKLTKYIVERDDVLLAMTGATIGKIGKVLSGCSYINQRVAKFLPKGNISKNYIYYVLSSNKFSNYVINNIDSSSAQPNISANSIGRYSFCLQNETERRHIVDTIQTLFAIYLLLYLQVLCSRP